MKHSTLFAIPAIAAWGLMSGCSSDRTADSLSEGEAVVVHLAVTDDGSLEATAIDVEDDDIECEQEGEHEGENEGCGGASGPTPEMVVGYVMDGTAAADLQVLGIAVAVPTATEPLAGGSYWFRGRYEGADRFSGQVVKSSQNDRLRFVGALSAVERRAGDTMTIELFDRDIAVDPSLPLNEVESLEEAAEGDIDCQQEGENEGENAGC